jgi:hypothetical protein
MSNFGSLFTIFLLFPSLYNRNALYMKRKF